MKNVVLINLILSIVLSIVLILMDVDEYIRCAAIVYVGFSGTIFGHSLRKDKSQNNTKLQKKMLIIALITFITLGIIYLFGWLMNVSANVKVWSTIIVLLIGGIVILYSAIKKNDKKGE